MSRKTKSFIKKIVIISTLIAIVFNIGISILNANNNEKLSQKTNIENFKEVNSSNLGKIAVALTTNIGTKFFERNTNDAKIYSDVFMVSDIFNDLNQDNEILSSNMIIAEEYRNILKTDFKNIIDSTDNKSAMLEAIIDQLEFRYTKAANQIQTLNNQKQALESEMSLANTEIITLKTKISSDYNLRDPEASKENIEKYLELKNRYFLARTYIIYINQFLAEYTVLNNYNQKLLDTLINNKNAIIKEATVVIPDSGTDFLKDFELLYNEEEYKE